MTDRPETTADTPTPDVEPSESGIDSGLRETAGDPEVTAMIQALRDEPDRSDIRADVSEASETIGTGTDR